MIGKSDAYENDFVKLTFNATPIANIADNAASSPLTSLYLALHSADPAESASQNASEVTYTGYARVAVPRNSTGFTITNNVAALTSAVSFPASTGGGSNATHFSVGVASSGATKILYAGALSQTIPCATSGTTPQLSAGTNCSEE